MAITHYYVSQQNGNDANDGLSAANAWKTPTKAGQTVTTPTAGNEHIVHIGSGTYREKFIPTNNGLSSTEKIYYIGDPHSVYLTNDTPGRVRITGCGTDEMPTAGRVLDWTGKTNVELWDVYVDGSYNEYACYNIPVSKRVHAASYGGFYYGTHYNCEVAAGYYGFNNGTQYNCKSVSGYYGFYYGTQYSCEVVGGRSGYYAGTSYNCLSFGSESGFNQGTSYGSMAIGCQLATEYHTSYNGNYLFCDRVSYGSTLYNPTKSYCGTDGNNAKHTDISLINMLPDFINVNGLYKSGYPHNINFSTTSTMNLQSERLYPFTPSAGKSVGMQLQFSSLNSSGNITVELQKYIIDTWTTQKSKTLSVADLVAGYNMFLWDTGTGDDQLTAVAGTWRFRITADANGQSCIIYGSNATTPSCMGHYIPDFITTDIEGKRINYGATMVGAYDLPSIDLDLTTYQTNAPSVKFIAHGEKIMKLPVKKNQQVTVSYQVRHDGAATGKEPQIRLQHPMGLITTQTDTHSAGLNTWEQLSVSVTPTFDGVIDVILASRDPLKNAWFSDPAVS